MTGTGLALIGQLRERLERVQKAYVSTMFRPEDKKTGRRRWSITEVATLVGRTAAAIRDAEAAGRLPPPDLDEKQRRIGYTLAQINRMRDVFGTRPWRASEDEPIVLAVSNFKGGVGKSTISAHLAEYLAIHGYRVLLADLDPQASITSTFGYIPNWDIKEEETLLPYLRGERQNLRYAIRPTYWDGLHLISSNLGVFNAEYEIAGQYQEGDFDLLRDGIAGVAEDYDVVVIDSPPALGMLSLNVVRAANAVLVPVPPGAYDFFATVSYVTMLEQNVARLEERIGRPVEFKFVRVLLSRMDDNRTADAQMARALEAGVESMLCKARLKDSAEINNAAVRLRTVYELEKPEGRREVYDRAIRVLDSVFGEIEEEIRKCWPSQAGELRSRGLL